MTSRERETIRQERDRLRREQLQQTNAYDARRRRIQAACCQDSPVRASNQVRAVMRMLEKAGA